MSRKILDPHMWNLENLLKAVYYVLIYQRPYSWDKEQIDVLLNDIFIALHFDAYESDGKEDGFYWHCIRWH